MKTAPTASPTAARAPTTTPAMAPPESFDELGEEVWEAPALVLVVVKAAVGDVFVDVALWVVVVGELARTILKLWLCRDEEVDPCL
jgi:hypothetical protein